MSPAVLIPQLPFLIVILIAFITYATLVRRGVLSGARIWQGGIVLGLGTFAVAAVNEYVNIHLPPGVSPWLHLTNPGALGLCAIYCVMFSYRMQRVMEMATFTMGDTKILMQICPASKLPDAQVMILPTSTSMRMPGGITGLIKIASGESVEQEAMKTAPVGIGKIIETGPGKLTVGNIYHVAVAEPGKAMRVDVLKRFVGQAALMARKANVESLCIPIGPYPGLTTVAAAEAIAEAIMKQRKAFAEIVFVALDPRDGKDMVTTVAKVIRAAEPTAVLSDPDKNLS